MYFGYKNIITIYKKVGYQNTITAYKS